MKLENKYSKQVIERGKGYLNSVKYCIKINNFIFGKVEGSTTYKTEVDLESLDGSCSCPYGTNCKHAVALYLVYQKGKFCDAEDFIKSLNKMSSNELKEMILSKLQDNPDWIIKHNIRKSTNAKDFIKSCKKNFSSDKIEEAEALLPVFSFEQLLELHDYIDSNYDEITDKIYESDEYNENYEYWEDEEYDAGLFELNEKLIELIVKKSLQENKVNEAIRRESLRDEIINEAESFRELKDKIKKAFPKEEYLKFLLNLKNPSLLEVKESIDNENKHILYNFIEEKVSFIKSLAESLKDKNLLFMVAVYKKDFDTIVNNFEQFETAVEENPDIIDRLKDIVDLFIKKNFRDEEIAKKLLLQDENTEYNKKQLTYLSSQIKDYEFIKDNFDGKKIEEHVSLLERLSQIDEQKTLNFINNKKELLKGHWTDIVILFNFLKKAYDKDTIKKYVKENQDSFKTSSHLKNHLKDEGIFISIKEGRFIVEVE